MFTKIYNNKTNKEISIVTQQYEIGTYIIINNDPMLQGTTILKEEQYHKKIRISAIKNNDIIISGSILNCKSKYKINNFNNE